MYVNYLGILFLNKTSKRVKHNIFEKKMQVILP